MQACTNVYTHILAYIFVYCLEHASLYLSIGISARVRAQMPFNRFACLFLDSCIRKNEHGSPIPVAVDDSLNWSMQRRMEVLDVHTPHGKQTCNVCKEIVFVGWLTRFGKQVMSISHRHAGCQLSCRFIPISADAMWNSNNTI